MAALTNCSELAAMNVGVAVGAAFADVLEDQAGMALVATHLLVHPAQWIAGLVMIELWGRSNGLPTGVGVAILARDRDGTMGIDYLGLGSA
jgi:hypothetical protein